VCDDNVDELLLVTEPYYDTNCNGVHDEGEGFIDLNGNGQFDADQASGPPKCADPIVVFSSICTTFSGPTQVVLLSADTGPIEAGGSRDFTLIVSDNPDPIGNPGVGNPIVSGSQLAITVQGSRARVLGLNTFTFGDGFTNDQLIDGLNRFHFSITDNDPQATMNEVDGLTITVTSEEPHTFPVSGPGGNGDVTITSVLTFLAAPTATPTNTPNPTATPSPIPTPVPPAVLPLQTSLALGTGASPNDCNGATQTFVVTGGSPPFTVAAGGGCLSLTSVPASGGTFLFTAGNVLGNFTITVTDALGKTASAGVTVQGPPTPTPSITSTPAPPTITPTPTPGAANIEVALFVNQASSNGDGTLTTVISALVTDANGATVGDNLPVQFSIVPLSPSPAIPNGVGVTSPGLTGQAAPCTLGFTVVPQPGDALSCIKYDQALQGQRVRIQAQVQGVAPATQDITLPDLRTATPTTTPQPTGTSTPTVTSTATPAAAHIQVALFINQATLNNDGTLESIITAVVTDQSGAAIGNSASVQFSLLAPVPGGVSVTSPALTGQTQPCTLSFSVIAQPGDALSCIKYDQALQGALVAVQATVQTPSGPISDAEAITLPDLRTPTATLTQTFTPSLTPTLTPTPTPTATPTPAAVHIQVALFSNQASLNNDGTLETVITAIVTDSNGAAVGNGAPVQFSLTPTSPTPVIPSGVSVTNPGIIGQAPPCTLGFSVVPQPGDALSCVKYDQALQGKLVTVQATVQTSSGTINNSQIIVLPDLRTPTATATATVTSTGTPPNTATPTATSPPSATSSATATPTATPPAGSIQFISVAPAQIGVRGSGLPEQSVLTFRVNNTLGNPISGVSVQFILQGTGSESINPTTTVSDQNGLVTAAVTSGIEAAPVRVVAQLVSNPGIQAQSTAVSVLGAPPAQNHFSMAPQLHNIAGRAIFGLQDMITVYANDRFGNAVPPGTAVSFVTNAASVVNPMATDTSGQATATLLSEGLIPPDSGIVTVMAYTHGEEAFNDNNGNGIFDCAGGGSPPCPPAPGPNADQITSDDLPEPFINYRPNPTPTPGCIVPANQGCDGKFDKNQAFERFVDTNGNGVWDSVGCGESIPQIPPSGSCTGLTGIGQGTHGEWDNNVLLFATTTVTFSGPLVAPHCDPNSSCNGFHILPGGNLAFTFEVHDDLLNPLVGGSTITVSSSNGTVTGGSFTLPDGESFNQLVNGLTQFTFVLSADPSLTMDESATLSVAITAQNGGGTFILGTGTLGP